VQLLAPPVAAPPLAAPPEAATPPEARVPPVALAPPIVVAESIPLMPPEACAPPTAALAVEAEVPPVLLAPPLDELLVPPVALVPPVVNAASVALVPPEAAPPLCAVPPPGAPPIASVDDEFELDVEPPDVELLEAGNVAPPCPALELGPGDCVEQETRATAIEQTDNNGRRFKSIAAHISTNQGRGLPSPTRLQSTSLLVRSPDGLRNAPYSRANESL